MVRGLWRLRKLDHYQDEKQSELFYSMEMTTSDDLAPEITFETPINLESFHWNESTLNL